MWKHPSHYWTYQICKILRDKGFFGRMYLGGSEKHRVARENYL